MKIIDIHAHVFPYSSGIINGLPRISKKYGKVKIGNEPVQALPPSFENTQSNYNTLLAYMDWCGIEKSILMPNALYGYHNDYFIEAVNACPERLKGVALVDLTKGKQAADELQEIYDNTPLFGMKAECQSTFACTPGMKLSDPMCRPVFECLNENHQFFFVHMHTEDDVKDIENYAKEFRNITFIICHMGADPAFAKGSKKETFGYILDMVKSNDNMFIDTSTVPWYYPEEEYPWPTSIHAIEEGYKVLGAEKMMWATDYPGMLCQGTMQQLIKLVTEGCSIIKEHDLELIMGINADNMFF